MKSPALKHWTRDVDSARLGPALAAVGVLLANGNGLAANAGAAALAQQLLAVFTAKRVVRWQEPTVLEQATAARLPAASVLGDVWLTATAQHPKPVTLELAVRPGYANWYLAQFEGTPRIASAYILLRPASAHIDWRWPMQVGIAGGKDASGLRDGLTQLRSGTGNLVEIVTASGPDLAVDFLFVNGGTNVEQALRSEPYPILANCLVVHGMPAQHWGRKGAQLQRAAELVQAKGIVLTPLPVEQIPRWFTELIRELSHSRPLDQALAAANSTTNVPAGNTLLATSELLLRVAGFEHLVDRLVEQLPSVQGSIDLSPQMSAQLGIPPTPSPIPLRHLSGPLQQRRRQFTFNQESAEATTLSHIAAAVRGAPRLLAAAPRLQAGAPEPRRLQHRLSASKSGRVMESDEPLCLRRRYRLGIRIAAAVDSGWSAAGEVFPQDQLPVAEKGHLLTVVFSEPHSIPEPLVRTIFLPNVGASSECEFPFTVKPDRPSFEGRVIVMHANRVLQTWLLCRRVSSGASASPVADATEGAQSAANCVPGFHSEAMIRSCDLAYASAAGVASTTTSGGPGAASTSPAAGVETVFGAALVLNHSDDGTPRATYVRGLKASLISLVALQAAVDDIKNTWDGADWEDPTKFRSLDAPEVAKLLQQLSFRGKTLHRALTIDEEIDPALAGPEQTPLQVVSARVDAHLPIEFCYSRKPARPGAKLCPHAAAGLSGGPCCAGGCPVPDDCSVVCPISFWGLSRVIEWHRYCRNDRTSMPDSDFALMSGALARQPLQPLRSILLGASSKIAAAEVKTLRDRVKLLTRHSPVQVRTWAQWEKRVQATGPSLLVLMVHVDETSGTPELELHGDLCGFFDESLVRRPPDGCKPVVLLLGCGTGAMAIPFQSFVTQFRQSGAAIVVSTIAELLNSHAPLLAEKIIAALAAPPAAATSPATAATSPATASPTGGERRFGEVMLAVKRGCLRDGLPIALALLTYGDADWSI